MLIHFIRKPDGTIATAEELNHPSDYFFSPLWADSAVERLGEGYSVVESPDGIRPPDWPKTVRAYFVRKPNGKLMSHFDVVVASRSKWNPYFGAGGFAECWLANAFRHYMGEGYAVVPLQVLA